MERFGLIWRRVSGSLWFVPALLVVLGVALAFCLVEAHTLFDRGLSKSWPRLFGAGAEGARGMLTAIASSMATVAGVVFSITIVALSLAASQYSPRVLRNFMSDRPTQVVLGAFLAIFAYCLIVLRTIRGEEDGPFVPSVAVFAGVLMAFVGIGLLIYFIHHVAMAIQVPYIVGRITTETKMGIERLFPSDIGEASGSKPQLCGDSPPSPDRAKLLRAQKDAYLTSVDGEGLVNEACRLDRLLVVMPRVGDFVTAGEVLIQVSGDDDLDGADCGNLLQCFGWQSERDVHQDVQYGIQQLVDVALRALSPSTHDPTTAVLCVDHLGALLKRLSSREMAASLREKHGKPRVWVRGPIYEELVETALSSVTQHAGTHAVVHVRLMAAVACAAEASTDRARRSVLAGRMLAHISCIEACDLASGAREDLLARAKRLHARLAH